MNIIQINNTDLIGRRFNGYDLKITLNELDHESYQMVLQKQSTDKNTISLLDNYERVFIRDTILKSNESNLGIQNLLNPWGKVIMDSKYFKDADIVHYHLIHNQMISVLDIEKMFNNKPAVWTIHDPWVVTGGCIYPMECKKWKTGCKNCEMMNTTLNKTHDLWKIKENEYKKINPHIVVASEFSENYIRKSPLTCHFDNIHKIPFGIQVDKFNRLDKSIARKKLNIPENHFVIAFRETDAKYKGLKYIIKMLENIDIDEKQVTLLTVGGKALPYYITDKYNTVQLGWENNSNNMISFFSACDVFMMPSLVESFGLMAIEAMAAGKAVIVFKDTVLEEITYAPDCGIAVPYKDWKALESAVTRLLHNPDEVRARGELGKKIAREYYSYDRYIKQHVDLYEQIIGMNSKNV